MTISTYTELKTALAVYAGSRADLTARLDEFIDDTEAKINRRLRIKGMEATTTGLTFTAGDPVVTLPTGFNKIRTFTYTLVPSAVRALEFVTVEQGESYGLAFSAPPAYYTFTGGSITLYPAPDAAYPYTIRYYKNIPALSGTVATNDLLTNSPDVYRYGCLAEAAGYLRNFDEAAGFKMLFDATIEEINRSDRRERFEAPTLEFDSALLGTVNNSILTDSP